MVGAVSNHLCIGGSNGQILRPNLQLPISRQAGGLFYGTCLLMSYFHQHTCSWHLYLLEKNNYSLVTYPMTHAGVHMRLGPYTQQTSLLGMYVTCS